jgi:hypothetical protein
MAKRIIKISVSRTVQVERFEPVQVTVEETIEVENEKDKVEKARERLYSAVTKQVKSYVDNEVAKYSKKKRRDDDD